MRTLSVSIPNDDGIELAARLDMPSGGRPRAYALFAHCFTCSKDLKSVKHLSAALTRKRIAVLRFDFTGLGQSEGDFADTGFSTNKTDLEAACRWLSREHEAPTIMIGHSLGGTAVLHTAAKMDNVKAVATIGSPFDPGHVTHLFSDQEDDIRDKGVARVRVGGRPFTIKKDFLDDLERQDATTIIKGMDAALLVMHSPVDEIVSIENAELIYKAARHPKSFVTLDTANHLMTREGDARYVGVVLSAWASRYLDSEPEDDSVEEPKSGVTAHIGEDRFHTIIRARGHEMVADEPENLGGTDHGPTPVESLMASLASCTAITLRMYADRKEWPLTGVDVHVSKKEGGSDNSGAPALSMDVTIHGDALSPEQLKRIGVIAQKCPVHRMLTASMDIETRTSR